MKTSVKFINGKWTNDDLDLIPAIKLRHGSKANNETNLKVTAISIAICWLKWGVMFSIGKVETTKQQEQ